MKKVVLKLATRSIPNKIEFGRTVALQMTGNPHFPSPNPSLAVISTAATGLENAYLLARTGGTDETAAMYAAEKELDRLLTEEGHHVEGVANAAPDNAVAIILSAGMEVKRLGAINIPVLSVKKGGAANSVLLRRKAVRRAAYVWQYSPDPFGTDSWVDAGESTIATMLIENLEPLRRYWFRVAIVKRREQQPQSDPVTFVVG